MAEGHEGDEDEEERVVTALEQDMCVSLEEKNPSLMRVRLTS